MQAALAAFRREFSWAEGIAALLSLVAVWLTSLNRIESWGVGLVGVAIYIWVFAKRQLYSDSLLQIFFLVSGAYGWWAWAKGGEGGVELPITTLSNSERLTWLVGGIVCALALGWMMRTRTNAALPYLDATLAVASVIAQIFLTRRILDNWVIWIAVDLLYAGYVYPSRKLYVTTLLYAALLVLAVMGFREWLGLLGSKPAGA